MYALCTDSFVSLNTYSLLLMQKLLIRHLLDAMHYEENLCENLVKTTFGKNDIYGSQEDMETHGIQENLRFGPPTNRRDIFHMPQAPYV